MARELSLQALFLEGQPWLLPGALILGPFASQKRRSGWRVIAVRVGMLTRPTPMQACVILELTSPSEDSGGGRTLSPDDKHLKALLAAQDWRSSILGFIKASTGVPSDLPATGIPAPGMLRLPSPLQARATWAAAAYPLYTYGLRLLGDFLLLEVLLSTCYADAIQRDRAWEKPKSAHLFNTRAVSAASGRLPPRSWVRGGSMAADGAPADIGRLRLTLESRRSPLPPCCSCSLSPFTSWCSSGSSCWSSGGSSASLLCWMISSHQRT